MQIYNHVTLCVFIQANHAGFSLFFKCGGKKKLPYLSKIKNIDQIERDIYIKSNLLKHSIGIFNISIQTNKSLIINEIEFIYEENKRID